MPRPYGAGSLAVLLKIGLFQRNWGADEDPGYQLGCLIFDSVEVRPDQEYYPGKTFTIKTLGNSSGNTQIKSVLLKAKRRDEFEISHSLLTRGGELVLQMEAME